MDDGHGAGVAASNRREDLLIQQWMENHNRLFDGKIKFERVIPVGGKKRYEYIENYGIDDGDEVVIFATERKRFESLIEVKSARWHKPFFRFKVKDIERYIKYNRPVLHIQYCNKPNPKMRLFFPEDLKQIKEHAIECDITADIFSSNCPNTHYEDYKEYHLLSQKIGEQHRWVDFHSLSPYSAYMRDLKKLLTEYAEIDEL